ncbi:MAG: hypothetical protein ABWX81_02280 [Pseudolabrys sp.]
MPAIPGSILEQKDAFIAGFAYPGEFIAPVFDTCHKSGEDVAAQVLGNMNLDVVTFGKKSQIEGAQIAIVADTQKTHAASAVN